MDLSLPTPDSPHSQLQPASRIPTRQLDLPKRALEIGGYGHGAGSNLQPADGRLAGRKDNPWIEYSEGIEGLFDPAEELQDLRAIDIQESSGPQPAVAVLTRWRAAELDDGGRHLPEQARPRLRSHPACARAQAGGSRGRGRRPRGRTSLRGGRARRRSRRHRCDVLAHLLHGHAAVLDHLKRAAVLREPGQYGARGVSDCPEPLRLGRRIRGVDR